MGTLCVLKSITGNGTCNLLTRSRLCSGVGIDRSAVTREWVTSVRVSLLVGVVNISSKSTFWKKLLGGYRHSSRVRSHHCCRPPCSLIGLAFSSTLANLSRRPKCLSAEVSTLSMRDAKVCKVGNARAELRGVDFRATGASERCPHTRPNV